MRFHSPRRKKKARSMNQRETMEKVEEKQEYSHLNRQMILNGFYYSRFFFAQGVKVKMGG
jgi:hypothetical protein